MDKRHHWSKSPNCFTCRDPHARTAYLFAWSALRQLALDRAKGRCERCGGYFGRGLHCHHRFSRAEGGTDTLDNLEALCLACHRLEHATPARKAITKTAP